MSRYHNVLWFWVNADHLKRQFSFFKCSNLRVCCLGITRPHHRQETMFWRIDWKIMPMSFIQTPPTEANKNYLTLENPDSWQMIFLIFQLIILLCPYFSGKLLILFNHHKTLSVVYNSDESYENLLNLGKSFSLRQRHLMFLGYWNFQDWLNNKI